MSVAYSCPKCGWQGFNPSLSDASHELVNEYGQVEIVRPHVPVCPKCFAVVETLRAAQARELRRAILGVALMQ